MTNLLCCDSCNDDARRDIFVVATVALSSMAGTISRSDDVADALSNMLSTIRSERLIVEVEEALNS